MSQDYRKVEFFLPELVLTTKHRVDEKPPVDGDFKYVAKNYLEVKIGGGTPVVRGSARFDTYAGQLHYGKEASDIRLFHLVLREGKLVTVTGGFPSVPIRLTQRQVKTRLHDLMDREESLETSIASHRAKIRDLRHEYDATSEPLRRADIAGAIAAQELPLAGQESRLELIRQRLQDTFDRLKQEPGVGSGQ